MQSDELLNDDRQNMHHHRSDRFVIDLEKKHIELFDFLSSHREQSQEEGQQSPGLVVIP